jgi:hypothetical protein
VDGHSNAYPSFIGVFDTVASLANPVMPFVLSIVAMGGHALCWPLQGMPLAIRVSRLSSVIGWAYGRAAKRNESHLDFL